MSSFVGVAWVLFRMQWWFRRHHAVLEVCCHRPLSSTSKAPSESRTLLQEEFRTFSVVSVTGCYSCWGHLPCAVFMLPWCDCFSAMLQQAPPSPWESSQGKEWVRRESWRTTTAWKTDKCIPQKALGKLSDFSPNSILSNNWISGCLRW